MCNLYRMQSTVEEMRSLAKAIGRDLTTTPATANLPAKYVGADSDGPVLRNTATGLELAELRWGFPPVSPKNKQGKWAAPITNIRNLESRWWRNVNRQWLLEPAYRCLVPFTRFAEPIAGQRGTNAWFETTTEHSCFAGIWRPWSGDTRLAVVEGKARRQRVQAEHELFAFLTTEPNEVVAPIHPKAMPVVLTEPGEMTEWLSGGEDSLRLQKPFTEKLVGSLD